MLYFKENENFILISNRPIEEIESDYTSFICLESSTIKDIKIIEILNQYAINGFNKVSKEEGKECYACRELYQDLENIIPIKILNWMEIPENVDNYYKETLGESYNEEDIDMGWYFDFKTLFNVLGNVYMHNIGGE